jgi:hypothetical protein
MPEPARRQSPSGMFAEARQPPVERRALALATLQERAPPLLVQPSRSAQGHAPVNDDDKKDDDKKKVPPPTLSGAPERDLEEKLKKHPHDADAKADVGSDESMDASDPPSSSTPGSTREPAPSSGFPE